MTIRHPIPLLRWLGNKYRQSHIITRHMPQLAEYDTYIEPFVGAAGVFFGLAKQNLLHGKRVCLSDTNPWLINLYVCLRDNYSEVYRHFIKLPQEDWRAEYHNVRTIFNDTIEDTSVTLDHNYELAAYFLWFNWAGYHGLWRMNNSGRLNVPPDPAGHKEPYSKEKLFDAGHMLKHAEIYCTDFQGIITPELERTIVYCDPPYLDRYATPGIADSVFTKYTAEGFSTWDHDKLARDCIAASRPDVHILVSGIDSVHTNNVYPVAQFQRLHRFTLTRIIASGDGKPRDAEVLLGIGGKCYVPA